VELRHEGRNTYDHERDLPDDDAMVDHLIRAVSRIRFVGRGSGDLAAPVRPAIQPAIVLEDSRPCHRQHHRRPRWGIDQSFGGLSTTSSSVMSLRSKPKPFPPGRQSRPR
jgi:hypothetical protein